MPNWCYTTIIFHGNKVEIEDLHSKIEEWTSTNLIANGFDPHWLGNIIVGAGLGDRIDIENNRIRCRGTLEYLDDIHVNSDDDVNFIIHTETAWAPMIRMWDEIIKIIGYKTIDYSFQAEEPGFEVYITHDPFGDFADVKYYVDIWLQGEDENNRKLVELRDTRYFGSDESLMSVLQQLLDTSESNIEELIKMADDYQFTNEDSIMRIYKYEIVDKEDLY